MTADVIHEGFVADKPCAPSCSARTERNAADWWAVSIVSAWRYQSVNLCARELGVWTHALFRQPNPLGRIQVAHGCIRTSHAFGESLGGDCQEVVTQSRCHSLRETGRTLGGFFFLVRGELVEGFWAGERQQRNCGREHDWAVIDVHTPSTLIHPPSGAQNVPPSPINEAFRGLPLLHSIPSKAP